MRWRINANDVNWPISIYDCAENGIDVLVHDFYCGVRKVIRNIGGDTRSSSSPTHIIISIKAIVR